MISTAGDATLSVDRPELEPPGPPGQRRVLAAAGAEGLGDERRRARRAGVGTVSGSPLSLLSWTAPICNDAVTITFTQGIGATDALRTGSYSKTLTFTLSTTTP